LRDRDKIFGADFRQQVADLKVLAAPPRRKVLETAVNCECSAIFHSREAPLRRRPAECR